MPAFYIAPEASIKYTFVGPSGARAVLNDPTDPDFVGYLDGEEAISGIDSPEIRTATPISPTLTEAWQARTSTRAVPSL